MNSEAIYNTAHSTAIRMLESGAYITPADTVCVIESATGRIYTGISRTEMNMVIHAEVDAVQNMLAAGEKFIQGLILIGTQSRVPMLPCNNCLGYILSLAPENSSCMIMMQDRMISIGEVGYYAAPMGGMSEPQNFPASAPAQYASAHAYSAPVQPISVPVQPIPAQTAPVESVERQEQTPESEITTTNTENATGDLLKNKVNSLLRVASEDETDEFLESLPTKKKRFGFFKK